MKKLKLAVGMLLMGGTSLLLSSCIGSFGLTNNVMNWNKAVGNKFVNELVFVAFWILPVYEVTGIADLLILNSIEFWKGENPVLSNMESTETEHGKFHIVSDSTGYTITNEETDDVTRFEYNFDTNTWGVIIDEKEYPIMTYVDSKHVKMITPNGDMRLIELSESGLQAYISNVFNESDSSIMANL